MNTTLWLICLGSSAIPEWRSVLAGFVFIKACTLVTYIISAWPKYGNYKGHFCTVPTAAAQHEIKRTKNTAGTKYSIT